MAYILFTKILLFYHSQSQAMATFYLSALGWGSKLLLFSDIFHKWMLLDVQHTQTIKVNIQNTCVEIFFTLIAGKFFAYGTHQRSWLFTEAKSANPMN